MTHMTLFVQAEGEFVVDTTTGEAYASISGTARLCDTSRSNIQYTINVQNWDIIEAAIPTATGLKPAKLLNEEQISICLEKYNPHKLALAAKAGMRLFLYKLAGYEVEVQKPIVPTDPTQQAILMAQEVLRLAEQVKVLEPKARLADTFLISEGTFTFTQTAKAMGLSAKKLNFLLREHDVLFRRTDMVLPKQEYLNKGWFEVIEYECADGVLRSTTKVTTLGQQEILKMWQKHNPLGG